MSSSFSIGKIEYHVSSDVELVSPSPLDLFVAGLGRAKKLIFCFGSFTCGLKAEALRLILEGIQPAAWPFAFNLEKTLLLHSSPFQMMSSSHRT